MSYLSTFNNLIEEFITKLSESYPENQEFSHLKTLIVILKKTNPRKTVTLFNKHCLRYREQIVNKDSHFILTHDFIKDQNDSINNLEDIDNDKEEYVFNIMIKLRDYWSHMDTDTIDNIWKYLNLFILLSDKLES
jgi:hypothetical protein